MGPIAFGVIDTSVSSAPHFSDWTTTPIVVMQFVSNSSRTTPLWRFHTMAHKKIERKKELDRRRQRREKRLKERIREAKAAAKKN